MKATFTLNGCDLDWENLKKEEQIKLADELNMQSLIPMGYKVVKNKKKKKTA